MIVYPAIDLLGGKCVRLYKGDFARRTEYAGLPAEVARGYESAGAAWLHLVDLDGAKDPARRQTALVRDIASACGLKVQTGGGVRSVQGAEALLEAGAARVVIGSLAVKDRAATEECLSRFGPEKICLAMDVTQEDGGWMIAVEGWQAAGGVALDDLVRHYLPLGLKHVLCTDISRDGTLSGCNAALYETLGAAFPALEVQASGGVRSLDDLRALKTAGVIVGKALYEGVFSLGEALEAASC